MNLWACTGGSGILGGNVMTPRAANAGAVSQREESTMTISSLSTTPDSDNLKCCPKCGRQLSVGAFSKDKSTRDGLNAYCRECRAVISRVYHGANHHKIMAQRREYRKNNRGILAEKARQYTEKNYQSYSEYQRKYRTSEAGKAAYASARHARRARMSNASGSFTAADIEAIRKAQGNRCYLCGKSLKSGYHVDHFIPLSKGGTNDPGNLRLACPKCNLSKGSKHPSELGRLL